ncbi:hypothetical protein [Kitasatospora griseola]|uniref:hypothetical protein n=1 Tax=Kitasatospora griseola TaxID=2064 RepID=UPI00380FA1E6
MARPKKPTVYREPATPSKAEQYVLPEGWNALVEYRTANAAGRAPSQGEIVQNSAVLSSCRCHDCVARRGAA